MYWLPLTSKPIPCFLIGLKFLKKTTKQISWGILEIVESEEWLIWDESDEFSLNKTSKKKLDKLDWIHADAPWSKTNKFGKYFFPMFVHFITNIKGFW